MSRTKCRFIATEFKDTIRLVFPIQLSHTFVKGIQHNGNQETRLKPTFCANSSKSESCLTDKNIREWRNTFAANASDSKTRPRWRKKQMNNQTRGRIRPRTIPPPVVDDYIPSEDAKKIYNDFVADLRKRQLSSSENFDKSILTYSSGGLAVSLTFLKDFIPVSAAEASWLLYASWALFSLSAITTIISFLVSYEAQEHKQRIAERYYMHGDVSALSEKSNLDSAVTYLNYASGAAFVLALIFTTLFVSLNLNKAAEMKENRRMISNTSTTATQSQSGNVDILQKGIPSGSLQKIPGGSTQKPTQPVTPPTGTVK